MVRLFVTGDNHIGRKYDRYPEIKDKLIESRFICLRDMIHKAEQEECDFFVVTGDLFDNTNTIKVSDVRKVVEILAEFNGRVLVLPGNHDYYTEEAKVWRDFEKAMSDCDNNIFVLKEFDTYEFDDIQGQKVTFYPAFCQSKHSSTNNLGWIKQSQINTVDTINIGIAHGAIQGITPDMKEEYFLMTETELKNIPMDVWLLGHTHIPYPGDLQEAKETAGYRIFNAGTHEQTDLHNNTEGNCFIIRVEKTDDGKSTVYARKVVSGRVRYRDLNVFVRSNSGDLLKNAIESAVEGCPENTVVRLNIAGTVSQDEYLNRKQLYTDTLSRFLTFEVVDNELSEEITLDKIRSEYAETSFAAQFMERLIDNPSELQMAYELLKECQD